MVFISNETKTCQVVYLFIYVFFVTPYLRKRKFSFVYKKVEENSVNYKKKVFVIFFNTFHALRFLI